MGKERIPCQAKALFTVFVFIAILTTMVVGWSPKESSAEESDYYRYSREFSEQYARYVNNEVSASEILAYCSKALQEAGSGRSVRGMYAYMVRSQVFLREYNLDEALTAAYNAVEASPLELTNAYVTLGYVLADAGRANEAADAYEKAVKDHPDLEPRIRELRATVVYDARTFEAEFVPDNETENEKLGSWVTVRGELVSIEDYCGNPFLVLRGARPGREIACAFDQEDSRSSNIKVGQMITIYGSYDGALPRTLLGSSRIVKIEP